MKKTTRLLHVDKIIVDEGIYPRNKWSWQTAYSYESAMRMGAKFPMIVVALLNKKYYLVDGRHRLEATKRIQSGTNKKHIKTKDKSLQCEVLIGLTKEQIYAESITRNITNGLPFSAFDKVTIIQKLKAMKFSMKQIEGIVRIPMGKIKGLELTRMTNTVSGTPVVLKGSLTSLAGISVPDNIDEIQDDHFGLRQVVLIENVCDLIENDMIDLSDNEVLKAFNRLKKLLKKIKVGK